MFDIKVKPRPSFIVSPLDTQYFSPQYTFHLFGLQHYSIPTSQNSLPSNFFDSAILLLRRASFSGEEALRLAGGSVEGVSWLFAILIACATLCLQLFAPWRATAVGGVGELGVGWPGRGGEKELRGE